MANFRVRKNLEEAREVIQDYEIDTGTDYSVYQKIRFLLQR